MTVNHFVTYLNSLHRLNASNDNALAEYQVQNSYFSEIYVEHPLAKILTDELKLSTKRHIILTGHAGDGKSMIALQIYKKLKGISDNQILSKPLDSREDILESNVSIVKDLSERQRKQDFSLMQELCEGKRRFLIVSNTGSLLEFFRNQSGMLDTREDMLESALLNAIRDEQGNKKLTIHETNFWIINLAHIDNLDFARQIFENMIADERWTICQKECLSYEQCPICKNIRLINLRKDIVLERMFLMYRRMYEYGTRLTLRQLTEHFAYLITSGLEESKIESMLQEGNSSLTKYMFFNRFFGDDGNENYSPALQIKAIYEVLRQGFGERLCPNWERKLWFHDEYLPFEYIQLFENQYCLQESNNQCSSKEDERYQEKFDQLRMQGYTLDNSPNSNLASYRAREQVRRMLYFLYDFKDEQSYLEYFLNSPNILKWVRWQNTNVYAQREKEQLKQSIYYVLQEYFTGMVSGDTCQLYITLNCNNTIRQTTQFVVAQIDWNEKILLEFISQKDPIENIEKNCIENMQKYCTENELKDCIRHTRIDLKLRGQKNIQGITLLLTLPFLDYVCMRRLGEVGQVIQVAYAERLNRFKAEIQRRAKSAKPSDIIMLLQLKGNNTFCCQQFILHNKKLEVKNV